MDDAHSARALRTIVGRLRAAPDARLAAIQRVTSASHRWSEAHSAALLDRARAVLAHGAPPSLRQVVGLGRQERSMNQALGWLLHPRANHGAGGEVLARLAEKLGATALAADVRRAPGSILATTERRPPRWRGGMPDLLFRGPTGALLIENKIDASESGQQYAPYRESFARWAPHHDRRLWLFAAARRETPPGYAFATHAEVACWLRDLTEAPTLPQWTRVLLALVAEDLDPTAPDLGELRRLVDRCTATPDPRSLYRIAELIEGWRPARPWSP